MRRQSDVKEKSGTIPIVVLTMAALNGSVSVWKRTTQACRSIGVVPLRPGLTHTGPFNQHFICDIELIQMFLGAAFGIGRLSVLCCCALSAQNERHRVRNIVLVHGA